MKRSYAVADQPSGCGGAHMSAVHKSSVWPTIGSSNVLHRQAQQTVKLSSAMCCSPELRTQVRWWLHPCSMLRGSSTVSHLGGLLPGRAQRFGGVL